MNRRTPRMSTQPMSLDTLEWLHRQTCFRALPLDVLRQLEPQLSPVRLARGHAVSQEARSPRHLWLLKEGRVRLVRYSSTGRAFALRVIAPSSAFCVAAAMHHCPAPCHVIADTEAVLFKLPAPIFQDLLDRYPILAREVLSDLCRDYGQSHTLCAANHERADQRLLATLEHLLGTFGTTLPFTRQQLAEMVGISRETANRILLRWQRQGALRLAFRRVVLRNLSQAGLARRV